MPNVVKYNCVVCEEDMRIINSNEIVTDKIKSLADVSTYVQGQDYDNEFSGLLKADQVERLLEDNEERSKARTEGAQKITEQAQDEAKQIIEQAQQELQQLRNQGYSQGVKQGYDEGYKKGLGELEAMKQELQKEKQDLQRQRQELESAYQKQLNEMESALVHTLVDILESAFSIQFAEKEDFIIHLLQGAFSKIDSSKEYLLRISREDYSFVQEHKEELIAELPKSASVEIIEDMTLSKNQCLIETDGGVFDCSLDTQMDNLTRDLRMLSSI